MSEQWSRGTEPAPVGEAVVTDVATSTEVLDTNSQEQAAVVPARGPLGRTVASLGDATQPGMWLKTPLVAGEVPGRVTYRATGRSAAVTLIPIGGAATGGSRLSLQAMQALGASLTDLPEIEVFAGG